MTGAEYLTTEVLAHRWRDMDQAFDAELVESTLIVQAFLDSRNGKVFGVRACLVRGK